MDSNPAGLDDPELRSQLMFGQQRNEVVNSVLDGASPRARRDFQYHDAGRALWRKSQHLPEIVIQRHQHPLFGNTNVEQVFVRRAIQRLKCHRGNIVPRVSQQLL